jgi:hypothetical protein
MRIRLVNSNLGKAKTHQTNATTWGELKTEEAVREMYQGDVKAIVRESQITLEADLAELPQERLSSEEAEYDYSVFFVTRKSKAGTDYSTWDFHRLRREVAARNMNNNNKTKAQLIADLQRTDTRGVATTAACEPSVAEKLQEMDEKLDSIIAWLDSSSRAEAVDRPEGLTEDEIEAAKAIEAQVY